MLPGERAVVAADGTAIDVRLSPLSVWPKWLALWSYGGERFGGPWVDGGIQAWDREPTDAEVLAEYETWRKEVAS